MAASMAWSSFLTVENPPISVEIQIWVSGALVEYIGNPSGQVSLQCFLISGLSLFILGLFVSGALWCVKDVCWTGGILVAFLDRAAVGWLFDGLLMHL